jgi:hypothetical protein
MAETPSSLVQFLLDLDEPEAITLRRTVTLSEIIERAREARRSQSPDTTAVEKVEAALDRIGMQIALFAPHGFDSSRSGDYLMAGEVHEALDDAREALGLDRKYG